jgi:hypothetical protein
LVGLYGGLGLIKVNLKTSDPVAAARKVEALSRQLEPEWEAMRENPKLTPSQVREAAKALLKKHGLRPYPYPNPETDLDVFIDTVLQPKREAHASGDDEVYREARPAEYLSNAEVEALRLLQTKPALLLSEALSLYLDTHEKASDERFRAYTTQVWDGLIEAIGDKPFEEVSRADANAYRDRRLAMGNKTTTVQRRLNTIKAVFEVVIREKELDRANPFKAVRIANKGKDAEARESFTPQQLRAVTHACLDKDDDVRWLVALQMDLGSRIAEVVGWPWMTSC